MAITVEGDEKSDSVVDARKGFVGGRRNAPTQAKTGVEWATRLLQSLILNDLG
jgi:hypothetical protein